jgi:hypothetical protein
MEVISGFILQAVGSTARCHLPQHRAIFRRIVPTAKEGWHLATFGQ